MTPTRTRPCPVCGQPLTGGRNAIYEVRDGIPVSARVCFPGCFRQIQPLPQGRPQPSLFGKE